MKARRHISIIFLAIVALGLTACGHDEPKLAEADLKPLSVMVAEVERVTEAHPIDVRGVVQPARQAAVSSRVMGPVVKLNVRAGSTVAKNQILLEIQPEASAGQLGQARGALAQAKAALAMAERTTSASRRSTPTTRPPSSSSTWPECSTNRLGARSSRPKAQYVRPHQWLTSQQCEHPLPLAWSRPWPRSAILPPQAVPSSGSRA